MKPEEHWYWMAEFIRLETDLGGPDPHLATLGKMIEAEPQWERVWRIGCYAAGYNVPTGEAIWQEWSQGDVLGRPAEFAGWIAAHWAGMGLRRERRAVRTPEKFARCLVSYAAWMETAMTAPWWTEPDFPRAWQECDRIYGMGRYVLLKLVEGLCRYGGARFVETDIRAAGGHSPREGLALLYPEHLSRLTSSDNSPLLVRWIEEVVAADARVRLERMTGPLDYFTLQVILCEYKKVQAGRQYPGRTHDTELRYLADAQRYWRNTSTMLAARRAIFPVQVLGEVQGWDGKREELSACLPDHGYLWSDLIFDYHATDDLAAPARWAA